MRQRKRFTVLKALCVSEAPNLAETLEMGSNMMKAYADRNSCERKIAQTQM